MRVKESSLRHVTTGLLQPLSIPTTPWTDVSLDFVEGLPKSQGFEVVLVVVDRLTKYVHFVPLSHPFIVARVASLYMHYIFKLYGMPASIVGDRDATFTSLLGLSCFGSRVQSWLCLQPITLSQMTKLRLLTKAWSST